MDSVQIQTISIKGNDDAVAYIDFCDGYLCVFCCSRRQAGGFSL